MKKIFLGLLVFAGAAGLFSTSAGATNIEMQRLYNPNSGEHFYTADTNERNQLVNIGWKSEGVGWNAPDTGDAVYRLYSPNSGDHHYTLDEAEHDNLISIGWKSEGLGWYSDSQKRVPLYRAYNPNAKTGTHNYTTSAPEQINLLFTGWRDEGVAWYGAPTDNGNGNNSNNGGTTPEKPVYTEGLLDSSVAKKTVELLNTYRASKRLNPIKLNKGLVEATDIRAKELTVQFSHTRPDGSRPFTAYTGNEISTSGEVIVILNPIEDTATPEKALSVFQNSPKHDAIISGNSSDAIGISYYRTNDGRIHTVWMTGRVRSN